MATRTQRRTCPLPPDPSYVTEFKLPSGTRNFTVKVGDRVRVLSRPGRRDGYEAKVTRARIDLGTGLLREIEVVEWRAGSLREQIENALDEGEPSRRRGPRMSSNVRTFVPERIAPRHQVRA
jgi:hypothetical protein